MLRSRLSARARFRALVPACILGILPASVTASTVSHFVALRRSLHSDRNITYAAVEANPSQFTGRVFELRGVIGGTAASSEGVTVMLTQADRSAVTLDLPASEAELLRESSAPLVRVLVKVAEGGSGNVVTLQVISLTYDSLVEAYDRQNAAQESARQASVRRSVSRRAQWTRSAPVSSRGGYFRPQVVSGDMQSIAAYYEPYLGPRVRNAFSAYHSFIMGRNRHLSTQTAGQIAYGLLNFADVYNVDPRLVVAMIIAESDFDPNSTSHSGAMGLGQLMPGTARSLGVANAYDPVQNLAGSIAYLRDHLNAYSNAGTRRPPGGMYTFEQVSLTMAAYNAGPGAVKKYGGVPPYRETQAYVNRVSSIFQALCQNG